MPKQDTVSREERLKEYLAKKGTVAKVKWVNPDPSFPQMLRNTSYDITRMNRSNVQAEQKKQLVFRKHQERLKMQALSQKIKGVQESEESEQKQESTHELPEEQPEKEVKQMQLAKSGSFCKYIEIAADENNRHIIPVRRAVRLDFPKECSEYSAEKNYIIYRQNNQQPCDEIYSFQSVLDEEFKRQIENQSANIQETSMRQLKRTRSSLKQG